MLGTFYAVCTSIGMRIRNQHEVYRSKHGQTERRDTAQDERCPGWGNPIAMITAGKNGGGGEEEKEEKVAGRRRAL